MKNKKSLVLLMSAFLSVSVIAPLLLRAPIEELNKLDGEKVTKTNPSISLTFPVKGESINVLKPDVVNYIAAMKEQAKSIPNDYVLHDFYITGGQTKGEVYTNSTDKVRVLDYYVEGTLAGKSKDVTLVFSPSGFDSNQQYTVTYGLQSDLSDGKTITTNHVYTTINNLKLRSTYYWKVSAGQVESSIESFTTGDGFRMISANGITNVRDMGGRPVSGNKHIKQGLIFRGGEMVETTYTPQGKTDSHTANLTEENKRIMRDDLGIKYEVDLRGDAESNNLTQSPLYDSNHTDIEYLRVPDLPAYQSFIKKVPSNGSGSRVSDDYLLKIKNMFMAFKNANNKHVYFHCWGGADRTGTTGFLLGGLLGMSYTDLVIDYELTTFANNYRPHNVNDPSSVYWFPAMIDSIRNELKDKNGNKVWSANKPISEIIETLLVDHVGLTSQDIADIKANLLED